MNRKVIKLLSVLMLIMAIMSLGLQNSCYATVITDTIDTSDSNNIASSSLFTGFKKLAADLTGALQWIIPIVGLVFVAWFVFKIMTGDEQDQQRYKKSIIKVLVCVVVALLLVTLMNLVLGYFGT